MAAQEARRPGTDPGPSGSRSRSPRRRLAGDVRRLHPRPTAAGAERVAERPRQTGDRVRPAHAGGDGGAPGSGGVTPEALFGEYLAAVRTGSRRAAFAVIDAALAGGMDLRSLYLRVFQPALREIGRLWQENRITVADEHLATAITQAAMARLYDRLFATSRDAGRLLVAACADVERHEVGLRMICDILEMEGWDTVFLGATVPVEDLVEMVRLRRPDVVALSASIAPHLPRVAEAIRAIRAAVPETPPLIAVGGRPFADDPGLAERVGADLTAGDAAEAAERLRERFEP